MTHKGAVIGTVAESAIRALAPIEATYALGWAVRYGVRKAWQAVASDHPVDRETGRLRPRAA